MRKALVLIALVLGVGATAAASVKQSPAREYVQVTFVKAVRVGGTWLLGNYVIEHDKDRMARGEACTRIYRKGNHKTAVVEFHCVHIDRSTAPQSKITLRKTGFSLDDVELDEFQFRGSDEGHGVPKNFR